MLIVLAVVYHILPLYDIIIYVIFKSNIISYTTENMV